jgi:outer membrane protein assembly factor BamD (BamD/ComL family)
MNNTITSDFTTTETVTVTDIVSETPAETVVASHTVIDMDSAKRALLLRMSNTRFEQGELRQAVDGYLNVIEQYPNSEESNLAQVQLLIIAQRYEQEGTLRLSLDVFERLEQILATD